jgi:(1->4)-alpha-D-glucan 1-alpha-D-glucosylmutase
LRGLLDDARPRAVLARELYETWPDGRIKLFLTQAGLLARRGNAGIFGEGDYLALEPQGPRAEKLVAFARRDQAGRAAVCIVPRLVASILDGTGLLAPGAWGETTIAVPFGREGEALVDAFTGEASTVRDGGILAKEALSTLPVALLLTR